MKNLILSLVVLVSSFVSFSQVIEVEFDGHMNFNCGEHKTYEEVIDDDNIVGATINSGGTNRYVINLDEKKVTLLYNGRFINEVPIISYKTKNGLLYVTMSDYETPSNKKMNSYIVINQNVKDTRHPKFTYYFISPIDNSSNGAKTI